MKLLRSIQGKLTDTGSPILKPEPVQDYTMKMRGCDISDQLMTSYSMLRHSVKWWRKLFSTSLHCASIMQIFFTKKNQGNQSHMIHSLNIWQPISLIHH